MSDFYRIDYRVYYEDTDAAGIVYHSNYLKFAERARTEWLRALGFEQSRLRSELGIGFVLKHCTVDFLAPARLDDLLTIETRLHEAGKVRMKMQQSILRGETRLAELFIELACINADGKPVRLPAPLLEKLDL